MSVTEVEAKQIFCSNHGANSELSLKCSGPECMAWRWFEKAKLEERVREDIPIPQPDFEAIGHLRLKGQEEYENKCDELWAEYDKETEARLESWTPIPPTGEGWKLKDYFIEGEDQTMVAVFVRETDPDRRGYCGWAGKPEF